MRSVITAIAVLLLFATGIAAAAPFGTAFTYQGALTDNAQPASGSYDLQFTPYAVANAGTPLAAPVVVEDVAVAAGIFTARVDFGPGFFVGDEVYLELAVRPGASTGGFQQLLPRQVVSAVPYAQKVRAGSVSAIELAPNAVTGPSLEANAVGASAIASNAVAADEIADGSVGIAEVGTNAIGSDELATDAAGPDEIASNAIAASELADNAVDTAAVQNLAVTNPKLADGAVTGAKIAAGAIGTTHVDASQIQLRPQGVCPVAQPLLGIGPDGSVYCDQQPRVFLRAVSNDETALLLLGLDSRPLVILGVNGQLARFECDDELCASGETETLSTAFESGPGASVVRRSNNRPIIAFRDTQFDALRVHDCTNTVCSTGTERFIASVADVGNLTAIALRADGRPVIAYSDSDGATGNATKFVECTSTTCSTFNAPRTLEPTINQDGLGIVVRADDRPLVVYSTAGGVGDDDLRLYDCANAACSSGTARTLDGAGSADSAGEYATIMLRADGRPAIVYYRSTSADLAFYDCANANCSSGVVRILDTEGTAGRAPSIARRADGRPVIAYNAGSMGLKVFLCADVGCASGTARTLDSFDGAGFNGSSIAVRSDDRPVIAYRSEQGQLAKLIVCGRPDCASAP